jgi:uncharacterized phage infection (PIP) family protein YhgE
MRRVWSWLLRSKVLTNKEYKDLIEANEGLRKDLALSMKDTEDAHQLLTRAVSNQLTDRSSQLADAHKTFETAIELLRSEYRALHQIWTETLTVEAGLKKSAEELRARIAERSR